MNESMNSSRRSFIHKGVYAGLAALPLLNLDLLADCKLTTPSQEGPFYRASAPWLTRLCRPDEPGEPLVIVGRVMAADSCAPLKNAVIDVWHANHAGLYDNQMKEYENKFYLRGRMKTDSEGRYMFTTILPAAYSTGSSMRAKHIHYKISAPGYEPLTTEMYFEGDKYNTTDSMVKPSLITALADFKHPQEKRKYLKGTFDVVLAKAM
ncbi:MAG TPA: hypothetical protein VEF04_18705 [Blastocatellia bacterium]|nr:hypothetical protein [Blastocatellia bacterium]